MNLYNVYRSDRIEPRRKHGGGVLCATNKQLSSHYIQLPPVLTNMTQIDTLVVSININNITIKVITSYISPSVVNNSDHLFVDYLYHLQTYLLKLDTKIIIVSDFNLPQYCNSLTGNFNINCDDKVLCLLNFINTLQLK